MKILNVITKKLNFLLCFTLTLILIFSVFNPAAAAEPISEAEIVKTINQIFFDRNKAMLNHDIEYINLLYDKNTRFGLWAFEHEEKKMKYLINWSEKQGVKFVDISPTIDVKRIRQGKNYFSASIICSTEYKYKYENESDSVNSFRIGTYHNLQMTQSDNGWFITKEWYSDPFADSLNHENIKADSIKQYILAQPPRNFTVLSQRRLDAVSYAERYSGAANESKYGFKYNYKYRDFNPLGGDCANFASQIMYEGGKFRKDRYWNYNGKTGSFPWVSAQRFKDYWLRSGRGSVIARGNYEKVYKASYKLQPGDFVAYEKKGEITHISVVTGADSKGYTLVNCHNTDRNRVPWDLGWSNKNIKFWLIRVHF